MRVTCFFVVVLLVTIGVPARAANQPVPDLDARMPSLAVNLGLIQPILLGGANVEVDFRWRYFVVSYSHGWNLNMSGSTVVGEMHDQNVTLRLPYTTGLGLGGTYFIRRIRSFVDLRFEAKAHRFDVSYGARDGSSVPIIGYTTFTLGGGAYFTAVPFANFKGPWRGINVSMSVRYWPNVASTLPGGTVAYQNGFTGRQEIHRTANIGIADTPFIFNISVGYLFR